MNIRKITAGITAFLMLACTAYSADVPNMSENIGACCAYALETEENGINFEYTVNDDCITITGCDKSVKKLIVPAEIDGIPVKEIGSNAFADCAQMTEAVISEGIEIVGSSSFNRCTALEKVTLPESLKTIWGGAFFNCTSLKSIFVPKNVVNIGEWAFGVSLDIDMGIPVFDHDFTVYGYEGTKAEEYALSDFSGGLTFVAVSDAEILMGDVDGDNKVTPADALNVLQDVANVSKLTDEQSKKADMDGDGKITAGDALKILQIVVGIK